MGRFGFEQGRGLAPLTLAKHGDFIRRQLLKKGAELAAHAVVPVLGLGEPIQGGVGVSGTLSDGNELGSLCGSLRLDESFLVQNTLVSFEAWTVFDDSGNVDLSTEKVLL